MGKQLRSESIEVERAGATATPSAFKGASHLVTEDPSDFILEHLYFHNMCSFLGK